MIGYIHFGGKVESLKPYQDQNETYTFKALITAYRGDFDVKQIGEILKLKGNLRISWSFDIKHNKNIDLIFFPQYNPYINYAVLYAKDFQKSIDDEQLRVFGRPRALDNIKIPYDINYDFAKEILSKAGFSESQQQRFFDSRFGSVLVPIEVEFEWYIATWNTYDEKNSIKENITFPKYDFYLNDAPQLDEAGVNICLGIIKSHKILPQNQILNFPKYIFQEEYNPYLPYAAVFKPLPTSAIAITKTNINDFIVNLRDKPHLKEGKIIAQLLSQELRDYNISAQQAYYKKEKSNLINPLWRDNYLVLIWDILPSDWCKVWILKMIGDKDTASQDIFDISKEERKFGEIKDELLYTAGLTGIKIFINGSYAKTFNKTPSTLKLYEGYIHSSGLEYLAPFGENYVKR